MKTMLIVSPCMPQSIGCLNATGHGGVKLLLAAVASISALALSSPAQAQDAQAEHMNDRWTNGTSEFPKKPEQLRNIHNLGACIAGYNDPSSLLTALPASSEDAQILSGTARWTNCNASRFKTKFPRRALRGAIIESFFERDFAVDGKPVRKVRNVYVAPSGKDLERLPAMVKASLTLVRVGTCVAANDPTGVRGLLATKVATSEERSAFELLKPVLARCLPEGVSLKMHKIMLRGFIAEGAYRAAAAAATSAKDA